MNSLSYSYSHVRKHTKKDNSSCFHRSSHVGHFLLICTKMYTVHKSSCSCFLKKITGDNGNKSGYIVTAPHRKGHAYIMVTSHYHKGHVYIMVTTPHYKEHVYIMVTTPHHRGHVYIMVTGTTMYIMVLTPHLDLRIFYLSSNYNFIHDCSH